MARFVILSPKTLKGKNKIHQHGEEWEVLHDRGHELVLQSIGLTFKGRDNNWEHDLRRVLIENDPDFIIKSSRSF